jgi:GrpB-like predicted nucleotidyltransferase (UPF0157 family)
VVTEEESLAAAIHENVALSPYQPSWVDRFAAERDRLLSLFPVSFIDIQHIGSTAVPGLVAKPVVDLLAGVETMAIAAALAGPLCQCGYTTSVEFNNALSDRKWFMRWADGHRTHQMHLVVHGGVVWQERLKFRDTLLANPKLADEYADLKRRLAALHGSDREAYTDAKSAFVDAVVRSA